MRAVTRRYDTEYRLVVRQHTATANRTLREFLGYGRSDETRDQLLGNWRALRSQGMAGRDRTVSLPVALRSTLGEQAGDGRVANVHDATQSAPDGDRGRQRSSANLIASRPVMQTACL